MHWWSGRGGVYEETREDLEKTGKPPRLKAKPDDRRRWEYRAKDGKTYWPATRRSASSTGAPRATSRATAASRMRLYSEPRRLDDSAGDLEDSDDDAPAPGGGSTTITHFLGDGGASPPPSRFAVAAGAPRRPPGLYRRRI